MIIHNDWYKKKEVSGKWHKLQSRTVYALDKCSFVCKASSQEIDMSLCDKREFPLDMPPWWHNRYKCHKCLDAVEKYCKRLSK